MSVGILSLCLLVILINESFSYDLSPKSPSVIYNESITFEIIGLKNKDYLRKVSLLIPETEESIKLMTFEGKKKITQYANYWNHYYYQPKMDKIILKNVDYHVDGAKFEVEIFSASDKSLVKLTSEPIKIDYKLSKLSVERTSFLEKNELRGKDIILIDNKISIDIDAPTCINSRKSCWVGFCAEDDDEDTCKMYEAKKKSSFFNKESVANIPNNKVRIKKGTIVIEGDPKNLLGSTFVIKSGNFVSSSNPITYGEVFKRRSITNNQISYEFNGKNNINEYDISLLSNHYKNPHKLCSCSISTKTCKIEAHNLILGCDMASISFKEKSISGLLMFSVSHTYTSRDYDALTVKQVTATAGFIQLN